MDADALKLFPRLGGAGCVVGISLVLQGSACNPPRPLAPEQVLAHQRACAENLAASDLDAAQSRCMLCLEYDRGNPECLNLMGLLELQRSGCGKARDWYKRALRQKPDFPEARVNLGVCFLEAQPPEFDDAITMFGSAIRVDPGYVVGRWNLARAYARRGDVAYARAANSVARAGLSSENALTARAFAPAEADYARADEQLQRLLQLDPGEFHALALRAYLEMQRSNYAATPAQRRQHLERAVEQGNRCVDAAPLESVEAYQCSGNLGAVYAALEDVDAALFHYGRCLTLAPGDPECQRGYAAARASAALRQQPVAH